MKNLRTFRSFGNPVFRLYYGGLLGQMAAMNMQFITRSLLIYRMTDSAMILGIMSLANAFPMLLLSLFGGVIADRFQKKNIMLLGQAASGLVSLGVALCLVLGALSPDRADTWWILFVSSALQGIIMGLMMPARQAILPDLVLGDDLMNAISLTTMGMNTLLIIAPALAGFLIDAVGFSAVYFTVSGLYLIAVIFISMLPRTHVAKDPPRRMMGQIGSGFRYIYREKTILMLLLITLFMVVLSMPFMQMLSVFTEDILKVGASGLGMLMSFSGLGAIVGSLFLASLPNRRRGLMLLGSSVLLGVALTAFSFSSSWHLSLGLIVLVGLGQSARGSLSNTLIQYYVDNEYRGRVMSILMMQFGLTSFSSFLAGVTADVVGVQWAVGGMAMILILFSLLALLVMRRIRTLD